MNSNEWAEKCDSLVGLQRELAHLPLDLQVTVRTEGEDITGFVAETPDPTVLVLVIALELTASDFTSREKYDETVKELGYPLHDVLGYRYIDTAKVSRFYRSWTASTLSVYAGSFLRRKS